MRIYRRCFIPVLCFLICAAVYSAADDAAHLATDRNERRANANSDDSPTRRNDYLGIPESVAEWVVGIVRENALKNSRP